MPKKGKEKVCLSSKVLGQMITKLQKTIENLDLPSFMEMKLEFNNDETMVEVGLLLFQLNQTIKTLVEEKQVMEVLAEDL